MVVSPLFSVLVLCAIPSTSAHTTTTTTAAAAAASSAKGRHAAGTGRSSLSHACRQAASGASRAGRQHRLALNFRRQASIISSQGYNKLQLTHNYAATTAKTSPYRGGGGRAAAAAAAAAAAKSGISKSSISRIASVGTMALPVVWVLYGTPAATMLGALTLYSKLKADPPLWLSYEEPHAISSTSSPPPKPTTLSASKPSSSLSSSSSSTSSSTSPPSLNKKSAVSSSKSDDVAQKTAVTATATVTDTVDKTASESGAGSSSSSSSTSEASTVSKSVVQANVNLNPPPPPPPPPPKKLHAKLAAAKPITSRTTGKQALGILGTRLDPIKQLAYGQHPPGLEESMQKVKKEAKETESLIYKTFDPLKTLKEVSVPSGEFTLDPLPGGTRKIKKAGTPLFKESENAKRSKDEAAEIFRKLDPIKQLTKSLQEEEGASEGVAAEGGGGGRSIRSVLGAVSRVVRSARG